MAKDDYYVMAAKVLVFLYRRLKKQEDRDLTYFSPMTKDFPVDAEYFNYLFENLCKQGYIEGVKVQGVWGAAPIVEITQQIRITPAGIDYLQENGKMRKILAMLPEAAGLAAQFAAIFA